MRASPNEIEKILGPEGVFAELNPNWEVRPQQLQMAEAIGDLFGESGEHIAIEAPTGVGKTLAYLVPALLSGRRVVVSTNTKTLQDQIINKDLPLLTAAMKKRGLELCEADVQLSEVQPGQRRYALMKGRANYVCLDRLERKGRQSQLPLAKSKNDLLKIIDWSTNTGRGDKSELAWLRDDNSVWGDVDARSDICHGRTCSRYDDCFVVRMRRQAAQAELIIVNHHLLMADLSMRASNEMAGGSGFGEIIPSSDLLVLDEAHTLEEIASLYFGGELSSRKIDRLVKDVENWLLTLASASELDTSLGKVSKHAKTFFASVPQEDGRVRLDGSPRFEMLRSSGLRLVEDLRSLAKHADQKSDDMELIGESIARRALELATVLEFVIGAASAKYVYWFERSRRNTKLGASPIEVADLLRENLFEQFESVVMTSATLSTKPKDGFKYFIDRIGAPPDTKSMSLGTPFDYRTQSALLVPPEMPEPDESGYEVALTDLAHSVIDLVGGGALLLFTSHRVMKAIHARLVDVLDFPVLIQGEAPKATLLKRFVSEAPAVLFATASFWEGVDVRGTALRLVMIDRLPFASPADPLVSARCAQINAQGHSAFAKYQVPQAILRLKQGFGRLVRSTTDRGVVVVCDKRIKSRSYGRRFLKALPDAQRISDLGHLSVWLGQNFE